MITNKKNQHYVPKFYLRNFSFLGNNKQIGVYNLNNKKYISQAKLKTQGSKRFFYGHDGKIEDDLADIEGFLSKTINNIIRTRDLPKKDTQEHTSLLGFVSLTDLRNPVRINEMKNMFKQMEEEILKLDPNADLAKLIPQLDHEEHIELSLSMIKETIENTKDLEYKILINETSYPFITSDFPIVKYNQFLEKKKWRNSKTGYGIVGLQIFIPINNNIIIIFYDSGIYKVGTRRQKVIPITKKEDIDQLNILQFLNCNSTIFFNEKASENYLKNLHNESLKFKKANEPQSELSYIVREEEPGIIKKSEKENLLILNSSDCEINLNISGIKMHSKGKNHRLNNTMSQLRKHPEKLRKQEALKKDFFDFLDSQLGL